MTDLKALLGDRYDDVIEDAARAMQESCGSWSWERMCAEMPAWADEWRRNAASALAAVLPRLLQEARDEGHDAGWWLAVCGVLAVRAPHLAQEALRGHQAAANVQEARECHPGATVPAETIVSQTQQREGTR